MDILVTVITSAYNAEKTIARTIESVLEQTYKTFEYIIINHGSTDKTHEIITTYIEKDSRIKTIHIKENSGYIGKALNQGLMYATGEYICFLDADDTYNHDFIQIMLENAIKTNSKVSICGFNIISGTTNSILTTKTERYRKIESKKEYIEYIQDEFILPLSFSFIDFWWNKLYEKKFLDEHGIVFLENKFALADAFFNMKIIETRPSAIITEYVGVNWTSNGESTSYTYKIGLNNEYISYVQMWIEYITTLITNQCHLKKIFSNMPLISEFYKLSNSTGTKEEVLSDFYSWLFKKEIYKEFLCAVDLYTHFLVQIELTLILLKAKYGKVCLDENSFVKYYNYCISDEHHDNNFEYAFKYIFEKDNVFSIGVQTLIDYIV